MNVKNEFTFSKKDADFLLDMLNLAIQNRTMTIHPDYYNILDKTKDILYTLLYFEGADIVIHREKDINI